MVDGRVNAVDEIRKITEGRGANVVVNNNG